MPCSKCNVGTKMFKKRQCYECFLLTLSPEEQEADARRRLECVPEEARIARVPADRWPPGRRWCAACQSFRRITECTGSRCSICASRANWDSYLRRTYVIHGRPFAAEDYDRLYQLQGGRCRICGKRSVGKRMATDHDHRTGRVRGLLCPGNEWGCNAAILGKIRDLTMARAIVGYLEANWAESVIEP